MSGFRRCAPLAAAFVALQCLGLAARADITTGLQANWDFHEGSGATVHDLTANANHGTISGVASWVPIGSRYALAFDGHTNSVNCGTGASLNMRRDLTISAWINPAWQPQSVGGEAGIAGKSFSSYIMTSYPSKLDQQVYGYTGGFTLNSALHAGQWNHVVMTRFATTRKRVLYVNGLQVGTVTSTVANLPTGPFYIGYPGLYNGLYFQGLVSEVRAYNRALTPADVRELFDATNITNTVELIPVPVPTRSALLVEIKGRGLGPLWSGVASVTLELRVPGDPTLLASADIPVSAFDIERIGVGALVYGAFSSGSQYEITGIPRDAAGYAVGVAGSSTLTWRVTTRTPDLPVESFPVGPD